MNRAAQAPAVSAPSQGPAATAPDRGKRDGFAAARAQLVATLARNREAMDPQVLAAIGRVPRHRFVPEHLHEVAYSDRALPIGHAQTVSAPHMVAIMCSVLQLAPGQRVLEVGGGSGYHAAVLAELVGAKGRVVSIEVMPALAYQARDNLEAAGYAERVETRVGDGAQGAPDAAPFDRISIAAATPDVPDTLRAQLAVGGAIVAPVGAREAILVRLRRTATGWQRSEHGPCVFVPLTGPHGTPRGGNGGGGAFDAAGYA